MVIVASGNKLHIILPQSGFNGPGTFNKSSGYSLSHFVECFVG